MLGEQGKYQREAFEFTDLFKEMPGRGIGNVEGLGQGYALLAVRSV